ncbi:MAG: dicarboxylate/amino acid:cation symporter [Phycisphaeraceae bacterium]|nr:dicarboxylate/amino acid:cation symporter [Phycisphaeraceae bacterium]
MARTKMALHWKIMIGLALGIVFNAAWGPSTWAALGVDHPTAFIKSQPGVVPILPDGVEAVEDLDTFAGRDDDPLLEDRAPFQMTAAQIAAYELETIDANQNPSAIAGIAWYVRRAIVLVGELFLRGLQFITVPIVLFSLVAGTSTLKDLAKLGRVGGKMLGIYITTTVFAITIGLLLAGIIRPGEWIPDVQAERLRAMAAASGADEAAVAPPSLWQFVLNIIPKNPFQALAEASMLQVVFFSLAIGLALATLPESTARPVASFFSGMSEVIIKIVEFLMRTAPVAVFCLVAPIIADLGFGILRSLAVYSVCVVFGLMLMAFGVYPAILMLLGRVNPVRFFKAIAPAQLLAFSSSSSNATLPVTIDCLTKRLGASKQVSSFVLPIGATINMDGTALYQGVATVFIAQLFGLDLTLMQQVTIVFTALLASIGTAGVPGAGIIMLTIVLQSVNIPTRGIAIILTIDRILDMCRTVVNVTGDAMVTAVIASQEKALLTEDELKHRREEEAAAEAGV